MDSSLAADYRSGCQRARVITEAWAERELFCAACPSDRVLRSPRNTRAVDFWCDDCGALYQLKSGRKLNEYRVPDAGYEAMISAIRAGKTPNLLLLQYDDRWQVRSLLLIPSFFFAESCVEKRNPLGPSARRAGWIGCNILLSAIAPEGKLRVIRAGMPESAESVRAQYSRVKPIARIPPELRGWTLDVLRIVHRIGRPTFDLAQVYATGTAELEVLHPQNRNVRPKIRQQLQVLRDLGLIEFLGRGSYALREI